jgi:MYXO-CTERM domain-containing protein
MLTLLIASARAATVDVNPGDDLFAAIATLAPGDTCVVHAGTYTTQSDGGSWYRDVQLHGAPDAPITVRAADGDLVILEGDPAGSQNIVNIGGEHWVWQGFEMAYGSHGLRVEASVDGTIADLHVHDTGDVGISMNVPGATYDAMVVTGNQVHDTHGTGECFYLGCNDHDCEVSRSLIAGNWCHDTWASSQGDGIELKTGSWGNRIEDNVIHDVQYPGITLYGTDGGDRNVAIGNVVWNGGDNGIQVVGDAIVSNNLVFDVAASGIASKPSQGAVPTNLSIVDNTVVRAGDGCLRGNNWNDAGSATIVVANDALYCAGSTAIRLPDGAGSATFASNVVEGADEGPAGSIPGEVGADLADAVGLNAYPTAGSALIGGADASWAPATDFNCLPRTGADVGAYERSDADNPGWVVAPGFKTCADAGEPDTDEPGDTDVAGDTDAGDADAIDSILDEDGGCGCASGGVPSGILGMVVLAGALRFRR